MTDESSIAIFRNGSELRTSGLSSFCQMEMRVSVVDPALVDEGEKFVRFVLRYLVRDGKQISENDTLNYGYWQTKFMKASNARDLLEVWERKPDGSSFTPGAQMAVMYWRDQHTVCGGADTAFEPPQADKLAAISEGVLEGEAVEGVRYPAPPHMSGWWFLTSRYKDDHDIVRPVHLYHVTAARPDLARFLALPVGFVFRSDSSRVWYDRSVASQAIP